LNKKSIDDFYIVAYEWGAENPTIETWACEKENAVSLAEEYSGEMYRKEVDAVPGTFQILNLLSHYEVIFILLLERTLLGGVLCFPHGTHPLHCLHASKEILSGTKYIIRRDVLYEK